MPTVACAHLKHSMKNSGSGFQKHLKVEKSADIKTIKIISSTNQPVKYNKILLCIAILLQPAKPDQG